MRGCGAIVATIQTQIPTCSFVFFFFLGELVFEMLAVLCSYAWCAVAEQGIMSITLLYLIHAYGKPASAIIRLAAWFFKREHRVW